MEAAYEQKQRPPEREGESAARIAPLPTRDGRLRAAIADHVVSAMKDLYGKGPTKVKAYLGEDCVFVVIQDSLTTVERTLVRRGSEDLVRDVRRCLHEQAAGRLEAEVEALTGRPVLASQTELVFEPEKEVKVFFLGA